MNKKFIIPSVSIVIIFLFLLVPIYPNIRVKASEPTSTEDIVGDWTANATLIESTIEEIEHRELRSFENEDGMTGLQVETYSEKYEPAESMEVTLHINEDETGYAEFSGHNSSDSSFNSISQSLYRSEEGSIIAYSSGWYTDKDLIVVSTLEFEGSVKQESGFMIIEGEVVETLQDIEGRAVYKWIAKKEVLAGENSNDKPIDEGEIPVLTGPEQTQDSSDSESREHTGPVATALISIIAGLASILGGAYGFKDILEMDLTGKATENENNNGDEGQDPAYEKSNVPEFPKYILGQEGEKISKQPDGRIEAFFPNGESVTYFPNGTVQTTNTEGVTWEEWADGTVSSTTAEGQFIVKKPDGTMTVREENGEEIRYNPDETRVETNIEGTKRTIDAENNCVSVERKGFIYTKHPIESDAMIMTSTSDSRGSLTIREKSRTENFRENGKWQQRTVNDTVLEGEIRIDNCTVKFKSDGSYESKSDNGEIYIKHANGSIDASSPDGTDLTYNSESGEIDYKFADGSYIKGNENTGEVDSVMSDGSFWKRDDKGNGSFYNKQKETKGVCREDGSFKIENKEGSFTHNSDGAMELKEKNGMSLIQRVDGTQYLRKPDGTVMDIDKFNP